VDLRSAYDLSDGGEYSLELNVRATELIEESPDKEGEGVDGNSRSKRETVALRGGETSFWVGPGGGAHTSGGVARFASKLGKGGGTPAAKGGAASPKVNGGTAPQQAVAKRAHDDGYDLAVQARDALANDPHYVEYFGSFKQARFDKVKGKYEKVTTRMEGETFTYDLTGTGCRPNWFAYTHKGDTTIWLCDLFWSAPPSGVDSQDGTVVHEHSHSDAVTDDIVYGQANAKQLAVNKPDDAVQNADNYEYFAETV
jgi:hypothetical protein